MATYTKGIDLFKDQIAYFKRQQLNIRQGHLLLSYEGQQDLKQLLSGSYTPKQTRGAFARGGTPAESTPTARRRNLTKRKMKNRGLKGRVPLNPINVQSGDLRRGAKLKRAQVGLQAFDLVIDGVDYAQYILAPGGTRKMVSRGIQAELKRRFGPRNKAFFDHFIRNAGIA